MLQRSQSEISSEKLSFILFCDSEAIGDISRAPVAEKKCLKPDSSGLKGD